MKRVIDYIPALILVSILALTWYVSRSDEIMHTRAHYTIGELTGSNHTIKGGQRYDYKYQVAGQLYEATDVSRKGMNTENGSRFLVEYDSLDAQTSMGHFGVVIPDSIQYSPLNGWRKPPVPIPPIRE